MKINKKQTILKLKDLEGVIMQRRDRFIHEPDVRDLDRAQEATDDLMFVRGLMDDIQCDRITEFPMVEKTNFMTGNVYLEDPDTPRSCSPSTELFWTM